MRAIRPVIIVALLGLCITAAAKEATNKPAVAKAMTSYDRLIFAGHAAMATSSASASASYVAAIAMNDKRSDGHLYLAGLMYREHDYDNALLEVNRARDAADPSTHPNLRAKALFLRAMILESQRKLSEAKMAWDDYIAFAKDHPDENYPTGSGSAPPMKMKTFASNALERKQKIEAYEELTKKYVKVRELVIKRQKELGIEASAKPSASTSASH
jgi:tetratricopeptide (TPR) repeat protein